MTTIIEPSSKIASFPQTKAKSATDLQPGDVITNIGVVVGVRRDGVFVIAAVRGTVWSLATATGNVHTLDVIWHESQELTLDRL